MPSRTRSSKQRPDHRGDLQDLVRAVGERGQPPGDRLPHAFRQPEALEVDVPGFGDVGEHLPQEERVPGGDFVHLLGEVRIEVIEVVPDRRFDEGRPLLDVEAAERDAARGIGAAEVGEHPRQRVGP